MPDPTSVKPNHADLLASALPSAYEGARLSSGSTFSASDPMHLLAARCELRLQLSRLESGDTISLTHEGGRFVLLDGRDSLYMGGTQVTLTRHEDGRQGETRLILNVVEQESRDDDGRRIKIGTVPASPDVDTSSAHYVTPVPHIQSLTGRTNGVRMMLVNPEDLALVFYTKDDMERRVPIVPRFGLIGTGPESSMFHSAAGREPDFVTWHETLAGFESYLGSALRRAAVHDRPVVIGRTVAEDPGVLAYFVAATELSREHVRLTPTEKGVEVTDLGSANGTWYRRPGKSFVRIASGASKLLVPGDTLLLPGPESRFIEARIPKLS